MKTEESGTLERIQELLRQMGDAEKRILKRELEQDRAAADGAAPDAKAPDASSKRSALERLRAIARNLDPGERPFDANELTTWIREGRDSR